ncbi:MAG: MotA/TolQ/ExbB proton channel family protein [Endomicrobium sp.]|jgi:biopolymer transport protein ExbB/TolQ|nr:MotA/TolQ/ExbB proton channel family protein [Endomicrobium sp.]
MFEGKSLIEILNIGGLVLYVLLGLSMLSFTVIFYKFVEFWQKSKVKRANFIHILFQKIKNCNLEKAIEYCDFVNMPIAAVSKTGIIAFKSGENLDEFMNREIMIQIVELERYITILGTVGNIAVYVGLLGTVLGIISAFHDMSTIGSGGIAVVIRGVSEALIATAAGLFVAIPASTAYNFFVKKIDKFIADMEYCSSAIKSKFNLSYFIQGKEIDENKNK